MTRNLGKRRWSTEQWEHHLGEQVRRARLAENWSQSELAKQANVSRGSVSSLELGEGSSLSTLVRVVRALGRHEWLDELSPDPGVSPIAMLEAQRRAAPRQRASRARSTAASSAPAPAEAPAPAVSETD